MLSRWFPKASLMPGFWFRLLWDVDRLFQVEWTVKLEELGHCTPNEARLPMLGEPRGGRFAGARRLGGYPNFEDDPS